MDPAIDLIVAELFEAVRDLERHAQALQVRADELRAAVDVSQETPGGLARRERIDAALAAERSAIDLVTLDELLAQLRDCLDEERRELEAVARRQHAAALDRARVRPELVRIRR